MKKTIRPEVIAARLHKGWAFMGTLTLEQYRAEVERIKKEHHEMTREEFEAKYKSYIY